MGHKFTKTALAILLLIMLAVPGLAISGPVADVEPETLLKLMESETPPFILDVRTKKEFDSSHVPGAKNISHDELEDQLAAISDQKDRDVVVYCEAGVRAAYAANVLKKAGFKNVYHLSGDMAEWRAKNLPQE